MNGDPVISHRLLYNILEINGVALIPSTTILSKTLEYGIYYPGTEMTAVAAGPSCFTALYFLICDVFFISYDYQDSREFRLFLAPPSVLRIVPPSAVPSYSTYANIPS